jgi:RNA polymerase sigma-70 factor (ECF subfamily)
MAEPAGDPLMVGLAKGQEDSFALAYDRFAPALFQTAVLLLGSREEAEDVVQDVFVGLVRTRRNLATIENLRAYLFAALRHAAAEWAKCRQRRRSVSIEAVEEPATASPRREDEQALRLERALLALPPEQREIIALKIEGDLTFAEAATVLGISPNTAASRYRYALEKLRAALQEGQS